MTIEDYNIIGNTFFKEGTLEKIWSMITTIFLINVAVFQAYF
jgi:hypothetical protein